MNALGYSVLVGGVGLAIGVTALWAASPGGTASESSAARPLKSITINTEAYIVKGRTVDRRSSHVKADEDMHIVGIEHFTGVQGGAWSDNGHVLSLRSENPWTRWEKAGTGMEPTGQKGYFGYCGRDYYCEVGGIGDVTQYEMFPAGTYFFVPAGQKVYLHCYANNFNATPKAFHHTVRLLYW